MEYPVILEEIKLEKKIKVRCLCECGKEFIAQKSHINAKLTKSCGCLRHKAQRKASHLRQKYKLEDVIGTTINRLTILGEEYVEVPETGNISRLFICSCSCGNACYKGGAIGIGDGKIKSCGCYRKERAAKPKSHGMSKTRPYYIWCGIISRTQNLKDKRFSEYGGRGIILCDKWKSFKGFWEDMQEGYAEDLEIDRTDVNGNYCKENCRWASLGLQSHNKRKKQDCNSEYIGVTIDKRTMKFRARIVVSKGIRNNLGTYSTEYEAALAYDNASEIIYGDRPNKTTK